MKNKFIYIAFILLFSFFNVSCTTAIEDYESITKPFDIQEYFNGPVVAWGMIQDYSGKVNRRFCVEIEGSWQDNKGLLAETFYFDDGEVSYRNWQLTKEQDGSYRGTAEDIDGIAIGIHNGFAFQFRYNLLLTIDNETYNVSMDDWMYQLDENRVMNKTSMLKFGVNVADITLFFDKTLPSKQCSS